MKFFTRELYQGMQKSSEGDEFQAEWHTRWKAYDDYRNSILNRLPPGMRAFSKLTLHDGVVRSVNSRDHTVLELVVDAKRNPWGPRGVFRVTFRGVCEVEGVQDLVGDEWLYEEVHLHEAGKYDFRVLFWKSDFRVVADEVEMIEISENRAAT